MMSNHRRNFILSASVIIGLITIAFKTGQAGSAPSGKADFLSNWPFLVVGLGLGFVLLFFYFSNRKNQQRAAYLSEKNQELENLLSERSVQLEATNKELEAFAHSISHDLRSPLRSIMAFSEILLNDHGDRMNDEGRLYQQRVRVNAERLDIFIDGILIYSNLNRQPLKREMVDVAALARQVVGEMGAKLEGREVEITVKELPPVMADRALLRVVLTNLISNAIKFTVVRESAEIEVDFRQDENKAVYCVQDNGIGLDMKFSDTIFQAFQRLHGVDQYEGTGIGLALVQRIITRHGGSVWVESEEDKGACFCFTIGEA